jgi:HTH-type transcriptional regulator/antitoxin HigA
MIKTVKKAKVFPPGDFIKEELEARGWTQVDLANILDRPVPTINEIANGKKAITPETALGLAQAFGTSPEVWLNLENAYRLSLLENNSFDVSRRTKLYSLAPVRELVKRKWLSETDDVGLLEKELRNLLEIDSIDQEPKFAFAARKSDNYDNFNSSQVAWFFRARQLAKALEVREFDCDRVQKAVTNLPHLSVNETQMVSLSSILQDLGVRFVIVEHLPQTYIDGAAFWLNEHSPVVALSLRYDRIDSFWFTLMHELAHIVQPKCKKDFLDENLGLAPNAEQEKKPKVEKDADDLAAEWLLPQKMLNQFIKTTRPNYSRKKIEEFAAQIGIHAGIVVGRLQYLKEIPYTQHRSFLNKVRSLFVS